MPEKSPTINLTAPGNVYKCPGCGQTLPQFQDRRFDKTKPARFIVCRGCGAIGNAAGRAQLSKSDILELRALPHAGRVRARQEEIVAKLWG